MRRLSPFYPRHRPDEISEAIRAAAEAVLIQACGNAVYLRGLIAKFPNACRCDCLYCGIRKSNDSVARYTLSKDEVMCMALRCAEHYGYGSLVLQSGERREAKPLSTSSSIPFDGLKTDTQSERMPNGLGITGVMYRDKR